MGDSEAFERRAIVEATASNLRIDAATAEVVCNLRNRGVVPVLLKGPALAPWYQDDPLRSYLDCDLWVSPADLASAAEVLTALGFVRYIDETGLPSWWLEHATSWERAVDGVSVDLHRFLQGVDVDPVIAWRVLSPTAESINVAGASVPVLSLPGRALYVTLHAAHHGAEWGKALQHLERALSAVDDRAWAEAAGLARALKAVDAFSAGLRLTPDGAALAKRLALPPPTSVKTALRATTPPPAALGFDQLASAATMSERAQIIFHKLIPTPAFIRHWWRPAKRSRWMLALGYLYRPVWLLRQAPRGYRAWRRARREVRRDGPGN